MGTGHGKASHGRRGEKAQTAMHTEETRHMREKQQNAQATEVERILKGRNGRNPVEQILHDQKTDSIGVPTDGNGKRHR